MPDSKNDRFRLQIVPRLHQTGIAPVEIARFEDVNHGHGKAAHYEWWYFDAHLDDGATVVVVFYTKPNVSPNGPLAPLVTIDITLPDAAASKKLLDTRPELFSASKSTL